MLFRNSTVFMVGPDGAVVILVDAVGEVVSEVPLAPGAYTGAAVRRLAGGFSVHEIAGDVSHVTPLPRAQLQRVPGHWGSAANPHFEVSDATRRAAELERRMARLEALERAVSKRDKLRDRAIAAAQASAEKIADAKALVDVGEPDEARGEGQS